MKVSEMIQEVHRIRNKRYTRKEINEFRKQIIQMGHYPITDEIEDLLDIDETVKS